MSYRGRFAPSPTGPLHFGSLMSALASYLDAKANAGQWLVRMEDLDPPRETTGAAEHILNALETHGLHADEPVLWQSQRLGAYEACLQQLLQQQLIYPCNCNRARLAGLEGIYDGHCRRLPPAADEPVAWRLHIADAAQAQSFIDGVQGPQRQLPAYDFGDFILKRKDGLHAYQLAVVVDDIYQRISHVVRGSDLLDVSARQQCLHQLLGATPPRWAHIPVLNNATGQKLSKQNHAPALDLNRPSYNLFHALRLLGQAPDGELINASPQVLLRWATAHWQLARVPRCLNVCDPLFSH